MSFKLKSVVPWGRSLEEYIRMFNLTSDDLRLRILDCAGGPASFNVEMNRKLAFDHTADCSTVSLSNFHSLNLNW